MKTTEPVLSPLQTAEVGYEAMRTFATLSQSKSLLRWHKLDSFEQRAWEHLANLIHSDWDVTAQGVHEAWRNAMLTAGWQPGGVVDRVAKVHFCLVPWSELLPRERMRVRVFYGTVRTLTWPLRSEEETDAAAPDAPPPVVPRQPPGDDIGEQVPVVEFD